MTGAAGAAIITGGGGGIGTACARRFSEQGLAIAVADFDAELAQRTVDQIAGSGGRAIAVSVDVADRASVRAAIDRTVEELGAIEVAVTAAGHLDFAPLLEMTDEAMTRMLDVHLKGTMICVQEAALRMRPQAYGRIVCISSVGALQGHAGASHYTAAKAGIIGFVNSVCRELGPLGITVNAVLPGAVDTPMLRRRDESTPTRVASTPVGRIGRPEDIAHAVAFLASREAAYVNGAALIVGGGAYT